MKTKTEIFLPYICLLFFVFSSLYSSANHISGIIRDLNGAPLPFASIYIKNTTYGVISNAFGEYFMELKDGQHTLVYSFIGYKTVEKKIEIKGKSKKLNVFLQEDTKKLIELEVVSNTKNKALDIIESAKNTKKKYDKKSFKCIQYSKNSIEKRQYKIRRKDTINIFDLDTSKTINFDNDILKFIETFGEYYFITPNSSHWDYIGYHDFADTKPKDNFTIIQSFEEFGSYTIVPQYANDDPYASLMDIINLEIDIYKNQIKLPITQKPIISPLSAGSRTYYKYDYDGIVIQNDSTKIHKIKLTPRFNGEPLLEGFIFIDDGTFRVSSLEVKITGPKESLFNIQNLQFIQNYQIIEDQNLLNRKIIDFTIKEGAYKIIGNTTTINSEFFLNATLPEKFEKNQIKYFSDTIDDIPNKYWKDFRPIDLKEKELKYISYTDSLRDYYQSEKYLLKQDSSYNKVTFGKILLNGLGHRNRYKGYSFFIWPVVSQFNFFGIGGYRHNVGFHYKKNINDKYKISTRNSMDYGLKNKDLKGSTNISIITNEKKYKQLTIGLGDQYKIINRYPSLATAFSRSNYVRSQHLEAAYQTEIINGLYTEIKMEFCYKSPIDNLDLSEDIIRDYDSIMNFSPLDFDPYTKFENRIQLTWLPFQKYYYRKNQKIVIGSNFPTVNFIYRKGLPKLLGSEVNFDYLELGLNQKFTIPHLGDSKWNILMGSFINKNSLREIEWKYFRGSDEFIFSNPLLSFQLIESTLASEFSFIRGNYLHNFNGIIMNKIPLINKLKFQLSSGLGTLFIPKEDLSHFEIFFGIARPFKLFGELVKIGCYAVTSANTVNGANFTIKIGANMYNSFTKKWEY